MDKKFKLLFILLSITLLHSLTSITNNFLSLGYFKNLKEGALNSFGNKYAKIVPTDVNYPYFLSIYSNYAGIDRGYAFYSPNLNRNKIEYNFVTKGGINKISIPLYSAEAKIKYMSVAINLTNMFDDNKKRKKLVTDISSFILNHNKNLQEMQLSISVKRIQLLDEKKIHKKMIIDAFNIKK